MAILPLQEYLISWSVRDWTHFSLASPATCLLACVPASFSITFECLHSVSISIVCCSLLATGLLFDMAAVGPLKLCVLRPRPCPAEDTRLLVLVRAGEFSFPSASARAPHSSSRSPASCRSRAAPASPTRSPSTARLGAGAFVGGGPCTHLDWFATLFYCNIVA